MFNRLRSLVVKELIQFTQDRLLLLFVLFGPLAQIVLIGGGVGGGGADLPVAVVDGDLSPLSREVAAALDNTPEIATTYFPDTLDEATALVDAGRAFGVVVIPPGFAADLTGGAEAAPVQVIVDASNVAAAGDVQAAAQGAVESLGWGVALAARGGAGQAGGIDLRHQALYNPALEGRPYDLTALLALILFQIAALVGVMTIVREREIGTLEQVTITPVRQVELILGKAVAPIVIGLIDFLVLFGAVLLLYHLPMRGSFPLLFAMTLLYLIAEVSAALMLSALANTQQQAITFVFMYIMLALTMSGYMVPVTRLPIVLRGASAVLPLRHYMEIVRGVMLKGAGLAALWPSIAALAGLTLVLVVATAVLLRRLGR